MPECGSELTGADPSGRVQEIRTGELSCKACQAKFPILSGVVILVEDVESYLLTHVKGVARYVPDGEIPAPYRRAFREAKAEIVVEHIEEDLEAERTVALYFMNHYLRTANASPGREWWKPSVASDAGSPLIDRLIRDHWDQGPFAQITKWISEEKKKRPIARVVELGCGVGGLAPELKPHIGFYLGVDSSFASVALGRQLLFGGQGVRVPGDLLSGPLTAKSGYEPSGSFTGDGYADLVVGDLTGFPVERAAWDVSIALNTIDMLPEPDLLPILQAELGIDGGLAIQSCPYIWHEAVAKEFRQSLPPALRADSARAVEWLYEKAGLKIVNQIDHLPWLFFKHLRQVEIYSVHLFAAKLSR